MSNKTKELADKIAAESNVSVSKATKNESLTRDEVKNLTMQKRNITKLVNGKEVVVGQAPILAYPHKFPNRAARRAELYHPATRNRKNTPGRRVQFVDVTVKRKTKFGLINEPTGWIRKIVHHPVLAKIWRSNATHKDPQLKIKNGNTAQEQLDKQVKKDQKKLK